MNLTAFLSVYAKKKKSKYHILSYKPSTLIKSWFSCHPWIFQWLCNRFVCCVQNYTALFFSLPFVPVTLQCTRDGQFVLVVARDATLPRISLDSIHMLEKDPSGLCAPVGTTATFAIYQFPVSSCGTRMKVGVNGERVFEYVISHCFSSTLCLLLSVLLYFLQEENGFVIYENMMSSAYEVGIGPRGSITRDSAYEWGGARLVICTFGIHLGGLVCVQLFCGKGPSISCLCLPGWSSSAGIREQQLRRWWRRWTRFLLLPPYLSRAHSEWSSGSPRDSAPLKDALMVSRILKLLFYSTTNKSQVFQMWLTL